MNTRDETLSIHISTFIVAFVHVPAFYICQPIIFHLFIGTILNIITVQFHFYLGFCNPCMKKVSFVFPKYWAIKLPLLAVSSDLHLLLRLIGHHDHQALLTGQLTIGDLQGTC